MPENCQTCHATIYENGFFRDADGEHCVDHYLRDLDDLFLILGEVVERPN